MAGDEEEMSLRVVVPQGSGECRELELWVSPKDTGEKLKGKIEKETRITADDMELFAKNTDEEDAKQQWLKDDEKLAAQEVRDGAIITVGVHGMRSGDGGAELEAGEQPTDAVGTSICSKGETSYYHAHRGKSDIPEEHRVVSGGAPKKLGESSEPLPEPQAPGRLLANVDSEAPGRPERPIMSYLWGDEKDVVKIYISADKESDAITAAGDGKDGQVEVSWKPKALQMKVHAGKFDWVLGLEKIYYEIVPEECKFRVSTGKRLTLTLKKKESFTWLKLLKPDA